jgi:hypothetical protein
LIFRRDTSDRFGMIVRTVDRADGDTESKTTVFVASTATPDRARDIVLQDWDLSAFESNPVILDNHNPLRVVGRAESASVVNGELVIEVSWDLDNPDPSIRSVGHQHLAGFRRAGSVGFRPGSVAWRSDLPDDDPHYSEQGGYVFGKCQLLEFSSASIPMNPEALERPKVAEPAPVARSADGLDFLFT